MSAFVHTSSSQCMSPCICNLIPQKQFALSTCLDISVFVQLLVCVPLWVRRSAHSESRTVHLLLLTHANAGFRRAICSAGCSQVGLDTHFDNRWNYKWRARPRMEKIPCGNMCEHVCFWFNNLQLHKEDLIVWHTASSTKWIVFVCVFTYDLSDKFTLIFLFYLIFLKSKCMHTYCWFGPTSLTHIYAAIAVRFKNLYIFKHTV